MSKKSLAIFFGLGTLGGIRQIFKLSSSPVYDVLGNRVLLLAVVSIITLVFLFFAIRFWRQSLRENDLY